MYLPHPPSFPIKTPLSNDPRNGPSEFYVSGTLKTWTIEPSIYKIAVETLLINGKYDEAQDEVLEPFFRGISKVKWVRFAESSHMPHLEEGEEFLKVLGDFLLAK
jgi:pimeloyl-ACP methyl ester carboxylesterase